jgi:hypothetical protein
MHVSRKVDLAAENTSAATSSPIQQFLCPFIAEQHGGNIGPQSRATKCDGMLLVAYLADGSDVLCFS